LRPNSFLPAADADRFFDLVRAGFCANRKQLINSLSQGLGRTKGEMRLLLEDAGIDPMRRAETLAITEWLTLWKVYEAGAKLC
jgi:16S rRNA (adenine1518-N6/adenine1519-N6)-dimethyltransferase